MKKIKILFSAMALTIGSSVLAQTDAPTKTEEVKDKTEMTMKDVSKMSKSFTTEMCKTLGITDKGLMQTLSSINENYEATLLKATKKGDLSAEEVEAYKAKLETNRLNRFKGILTTEQVKLYQQWKSKPEAETKK